MIADNRPSMQAERYWIPPSSLHVSATVKASQDPQILRGLTYASSSYVCVRTNSTHMHAIFNACTSHIHHRPCRSFISPLHPPPPLMWDTLESEEYSPGERNRVDLRSFCLEESCHWSLLRLLVSLSLVLLPSIAHSTHPPLSNRPFPLTFIINSFSPHPRWRSLFPELHTLFFVPAATPTPLLPQEHVIWALQCAQLISLKNHLECCSNLWSSGLQGIFDVRLEVPQVEVDFAHTNWLCKVLACSLYFWQVVFPRGHYMHVTGWRGEVSGD